MSGLHGEVTDMRYYKIIDNGYIKSVGTGASGVEITQNEYAAVMAAIGGKPPRTDTTDYRLTTELEWESYEVPPPDPNPDLDAAEVFELIFGGEGE